MNWFMAASISLGALSTGRPSRSNRKYAMPMSTVPRMKIAADTIGLRVLMASFLRPALMRSMILARRTTPRLNTSVTKKMATRHPTVVKKACGEKKKWKSRICVLNSDAVKNVMTWENPTPSTMPSASAPPETIAVSMAITRETWPRLMPSTWYRPNSFCAAS